MPAYLLLNTKYTSGVKKFEFYSFLYNYKRLFEHYVASRCCNTGLFIAVVKVDDFF